MTINEDIIRGECRTQAVAGLSDCGLNSFEAKTQAKTESKTQARTEAEAQNEALAASETEAAHESEAETEADGKEAARVDEAAQADEATEASEAAPPDDEQAVGAFCQTCGTPSSSSSSLELMNSEQEAEVTALRPHSVYDSDAAGGSTVNQERSGNSVNMSIQAGGLDFKLDTRIDPNQQTIELSAKLELCLSMLAASQNRLEVAFVRIGQLEAELAVLRTIHGRSDKTAQAPPAEQDVGAGRAGGSDLG